MIVQPDAFLMQKSALASTVHVLYGFYAVLSDLIHCAVLEIWHSFGHDYIALLALSAALSAQGVSKQGDA